MRLLRRKSGGSRVSDWLLCDAEGNGAGSEPFLSNRL